MTSIRTIKKLQDMLFLPVLIAFTIGSLPVLLPITLCRWLSGVRSEPARGNLAAASGAAL